MTFTKSFRNRFNGKIVKNDSNGCWEWNGSMFSQGYGAIWHETQNKRAHIVSYKIHNGDIKKGLCVCHKCDNKKCVNPEHLFLGTQQDNIDDCMKKGRKPTGEGHYLYGVKGEDHPSYGIRGKDHHLYDSTSHIFEHKKKGWLVRCTQYYLRDVFGLDQGNISALVLGKRKSVTGWSLIGGSISA